MKKIKGTGVAIVTPFKNDTSIDFSALKKITEHVIGGGVNYIVVMGTTGESVTLTKDEKKAVLSYVLEVTDKRVPVIAGIGGNNTQEVINCLRHSNLSDVDAILSVVPYYNKPGQKGIFQHFKTIAACSPVPVILYNVPGRTSCSMSAETCLELAHECENIAGIKESSGDMSLVTKIIKGKPENFVLLSGDDMLSIPIISLGGSGVISVLANAFPSQCSEMIGHALKSNFRTAREHHFRLVELIDLCFAEGNPSGIKAMLSTLNLSHNVLRLPLVPVSRPLMSRIQKAVEDFNKQ
ncbi:MAG TPA: 4-hydroxy-tetrahydrodipicolinate synthase [Bacteroidales bacterium]|jgi:4-hydroxy-tetrahydrodipicolinate synthase|nr:4-hydroxy-tetrahydrodipicolinate synthase [Bacteroidales bacterium]HNR41865.1 4-hydroxy-tetrahydrodipicolinate synthase [Bacteroidales bacterium]HPM19489.1 4-hydroxy-tetrahydrodipicolinate synthase [Bacteroidales bacterium]HQG77506.1 4-hydroxy-tetrahydrodipicolinate synthase [Bacteroidales bacterium]